MKKLNYLLVLLFTVTLSMTSFNALADRNHDDDDDHGSSYDNDHGKKKGKGHEKNAKKEKKSKKNRRHSHDDDDKGHHKKRRDVVGICHNTGDELNPVVFLTVSRKAARKHEARHDDVIGVDECEILPPPPPVEPSPPDEPAPPAEPSVPTPDPVALICAIVEPNQFAKTNFGLEDSESAIAYDHLTGLISSQPGSPEFIAEVTVGVDGLFSADNTIVYISPFDFTGSSNAPDTETEVTFNILSIEDPNDSTWDIELGSVILSTQECPSSPPPTAPPGF